MATALPMATPMMVPFTPKTEAATAARIAPMADAAICFGLSFMAASGGLPLG